MPSKHLCSHHHVASSVPHPVTICYCTPLSLYLTVTVPISSPSSWESNRRLLHCHCTPLSLYLSPPPRRGRATVDCTSLSLSLSLYLSPPPRRGRATADCASLTVSHRHRTCRHCPSVQPVHPLQPAVYIISGPKCGVCVWGAAKNLWSPQIFQNCGPTERHPHTHHHPTRPTTNTPASPLAPRHRQSSYHLQNI